MNYEGAEGLEFGAGNTKVDPSVAAKLPKGCRIVSTERHGISFWATSGRIDVELEDGTPQTFFMKVVSKETGKQMMNGEFESMAAIHSLLPDFVPQPIAWELTRLYGTRTSFSRLAALHQNSKSPNGKFGFYINTCNGNLSQDNKWEESWEVYFTKGMRHTFEREIAIQGPDPELDKLVPVILDKVIPRLLRPLQTEGRIVKPSLVHGDLWYANTGIDADTDKPLVFDACCFYAHNEYELGQWRPVCNRLGPEYVKAYHSYVQISPPEEDYEGRLDLYKLKFNTHVSALFPQDPNIREQMLGDVRDLVKRYG